MNKQYSPLKPYRHSFQEEWLIGLLLVVALFQVGFCLHESAGLARPGQTLSVLPAHCEEVAKQPHGAAPLPAKPSAPLVSLADRG